jgi:hypothetical protein
MPQTTRYAAFRGDTLAAISAANWRLVSLSVLVRPKPQLFAPFA